MNNTENTKLFINPAGADDWVWRMENGVGAWVKEKGDKSYWYFVLWLCKRLNILKGDVSHRDFARLLVEECTGAVDKADTEDKIFHSMGKFKYKNNLKGYDKKEFIYTCIPTYVNELSALLTRDVVAAGGDDHFTLEGRMREHLAKKAAREDYARVCVHPIYNGKMATLSFVRYVSQRFMDENRPSSTTIYHCVDETLTEEAVEMYYGRFSDIGAKIFLASTHSFTVEVKNEADRHNIGLVLVNPLLEVTEECYEVPRAQMGQRSEVAQWKRMFVGWEEMTVPLLVYDDGRIDDSLSFVLYKYASFDKEKLFVAAPYLSDAEIERTALELVSDEVAEYVALLLKCGTADTPPQCAIDPYQLARKRGLTVTRGDTSPNMANIDLARRVVTLSDRLKPGAKQERFSLSHEIGHDEFHSYLTEKLGAGYTISPYTKQWLEHHAQHFASCLLMPAPVISLLYAIYWKKCFHSEDVRPIYIDVDYYHDPVFQRVVAPVARKMNVSLQAAYIRLKKMGFIHHCCEQSA